MKKALILLWLVCFLGMGASAQAQEREIPASNDWTPPDLSQLTETAQPELLVLKIAQEEIGYVEGPASDESKYGQWFSGKRVAWCAEFLTWCVDQADKRYGTSLMKNIYPWYGGTKDGAPFFIEKGRFISDTGQLLTREKQWLIDDTDYLKDNAYLPYPGDYIWFYYHKRSLGTEHVAIVEGISRDADGMIQIHVIEGNNPDRVQRATYEITDWRIYGFGTPVKRAHANLRLYNRGDDVGTLQKDMIALGYYQQEKGRENTFTKKLESSVKQLQKEFKLSTTGIVDIATRSAMESALLALEKAE